MGKIYNIQNKLGGEKPKIQVADNVFLTVNTNFKNVLVIQSLVKKIEQEETAENIEKIVTLALGKESMKYINTMGDLKVAFQAIVAAIQDLDESEFEKSLIEKEVGEEDKTETEKK